MKKYFAVLLATSLLSACANTWDGVKTDANRVGNKVENKLERASDKVENQWERTKESTKDRWNKTMDAMKTE